MIWKILSMCITKNKKICSGDNTKYVAGQTCQRDEACDHVSKQTSQEKYCQLGLKGKDTGRNEGHLSDFRESTSRKQVAQSAGPLLRVQWVGLIDPLQVQRPRPTGLQRSQRLNSLSFHGLRGWIEPQRIILRP